MKPWRWSEIITDEICGQVNGAINVVISGATTPATYNWSSGETTEDLSNIAGGTYTLNITDAIGCTATTNSTVQNNTGTLALSNQVLTNEVCGNGGLSRTTLGIHHQDRTHNRNSKHRRRKKV